MELEFINLVRNSSFGGEYTTFVNELFGPGDYEDLNYKRKNFKLSFSRAKDLALLLIGASEDTTKNGKRIFKDFMKNLIISSTGVSLTENNLFIQDNPPLNISGLSMGAELLKEGPTKENDIISYSNDGSTRSIPYSLLYFGEQSSPSFSVNNLLTAIFGKEIAGNLAEFSKCFSINPKIMFSGEESLKKGGLVAFGIKGGFRQFRISIINRDVVGYTYFIKESGNIKHNQTSY